jgi:hypothetical protein
MRSDQPLEGATPLAESETTFNLWNGVFGFKPEDLRLAFVTDLPHGHHRSIKDWLWLRKQAFQWAKDLQGRNHNGLRGVGFFVYAATGDDGADLPGDLFRCSVNRRLPRNMSEAARVGQRIKLVTVLGIYDCLVWATRWSATSVLNRLVGGKHQVRIATLPGFTSQMMPAFAVDAREAARRTMILEVLLNKATAAEIRTKAEGRVYELFVDLRRFGHPYRRRASTGRITVPGQVSNGIPAETFVAPYDGKNSRTSGWLPIQLTTDSHVLFYHFECNRVVKVIGRSRWLGVEQALLAENPNRGNLGELGFGIIASMGVKPLTGFKDPDDVMLFQEKLGFHIAFGTGGRIRAPIHRDHVFLPGCMPRVKLVSVTLVDCHGRRRTIMENGDYVPGLF